MKKDNSVYLMQIIDYISDVSGYIELKKFEDFETDMRLQDAVLRKLTLIGEAVRRLSDDFVEKYRKSLPLAEAVATRNKLIHDYDDIDLKIVWTTVTKDLVDLENKLMKLLRKEEV